jgi:hypothetical protein
MKSEKINNIVFVSILVIAILIIYRYKNTIEKFESITTESPSTQPTPPTQPTDALSTYNMQQFYAANPPVSSTVIKETITHNIPEPVTSDIVIGDDKQLRFGTLKTETDKNKNTYILQSSNVNSPHLRMTLQGKQSPDHSFQIWGGACNGEGVCSGDGIPLHTFSSVPTQVMRNRQNEIVHEIQSNGNQWNKANVNAQNVNVRGRIYFSQAEKDDIINPSNNKFSSQKDNPLDRIHKSSPHYIEKVGSTNENKLRITINNNEKEGVEIYSRPCTSTNCSSTGEKIFSVDGKGNTFTKGNLEVGGTLKGKTNIQTSPTTPTTPSTTTNTENHYVKGTTNAQDVNVRGRIYFSQAGENDIINPHHKDFNKNKADPYVRIHNSDPYYIEKISRGSNNSRLRITINDDPNEGIEIFSNSCKNKSECSTKEGERVALIDGNGNLYLKGNIFVNQNLNNR